MEALTLNKVLSRIKNLIESHNQVNSFSHGFSVTDWIKSEDISYLTVYALIDQGFTVSSDSKETTIPFRFFVADLVKKDKSNETEVYSDALAIAEDIKALLSDPQFDDWFINPTNSGQMLYEEFEDFVGGVYIDINIGWIFRNDRCQVPT